MSDIIVILRRGRVLLAHSTQRDANQPEWLDWQPAQEHAAEARLRCGTLEIAQVGRTHAVLLSRPLGSWGAHVGSNEHGVTIGCTFAVSKAPLAPIGLAGTDLVRLGLERAARAERAIDVMVELLQTHGQAPAEDRLRAAGHACFVVADPEQAFVLETAGSSWAVDQVRGTRALSGELSITGFADRHGDWLRTTLGGIGARQARARALGEHVATTRDLARVLRDHGQDRAWPRYGWLGAATPSICMHAGGLGLGQQTTGAWLSELRPSGSRHWATATAAPCASLFKPVLVGHPVELGPPPEPVADEHSLWWRHERFHRQLVRDPERLCGVFQAERDALEDEWLAATPPESGEAFAQADLLLGQWTERVRAAAASDRRPLVTRRAWRARNRDVHLG